MLDVFDLFIREKLYLKYAEKFLEAEQIDEVIEALSRSDHNERFVEATMTRFVGAKLALTQDFSRWRHWETMPKRIRLGPSGKRAPLYSESLPSESLLGSTVPFLEMMESKEFPIEWINPDPLMDMLEEFRREDFSEMDWD